MKKQIEFQDHSLILREYDFDKDPPLLVKNYLQR